MDSGFLAPGESLDEDYDVLKELLPEEVVGIMDQLVCFEVGSFMSSIDPCGLYLMLIAGLLDGVAYGSSAFTVPVHF